MKLLDVVVLQALMAWVWISVIVYVVAGHGGRLLRLEGKKPTAFNPKKGIEIDTSKLELPKGGSAAMPLCTCACQQHPGFHTKQHMPAPPPGYPPLPPQDDIDLGM